MQELLSRIGRWFSGFARRQELRNLESAEISRIAAEGGTTVSELYALEKAGPGSARLLPRRLLALDLDSEAIARKEPAAWRDLERTCSLCGRKKICERDLDRGAANAEWETYCPNALTLQSLRG